MEYYFSRCTAYKNLARHYSEIKHLLLKDLFLEDKKRFERFSIRLGPILFDYSKNRITSKTIDLLLDLADEALLKQKIEAITKNPCSY